MEFDRAKVVDQAFLRFLDEEIAAEKEAPAAASPAPDAPYREGSALRCGDLWELTVSMMVSRHLDLEARAMRARGEGFYTIGSSGHEGNAVLGRLARPTDPAYLHYRSGALMAERYRKLEGLDFVRDTALSLAASREDPAAGGRHKVWGSRRLWVPPQTSTIASHLPKSVGAAFALERARSLGRPLEIPGDSIVLCTFGDASVNHAAAQTAMNAASWAAHQKIPMPILFACEDNGIGVSVHTPERWIEDSVSRRPHLVYLRAEGLDPVASWDVAARAFDLCRRYRTPVFLHLELVRLLGHAGSDREWDYHSEKTNAAAEARDPLLVTARRVLERGIRTATEVRDAYEAMRSQVQEAARRAAATEKLRAQEVAACLTGAGAPDSAPAPEPASPEERARVFGGPDRLPERDKPRHMAHLINRGLHDLMLRYPQTILFGEDVARKGGVYHVTAGLADRFGVGRVFNTLLDETTILGMAIGAAHLGFLPLPEIQYLAYVHNAEDQLRGEACSQMFFSAGAWRNPMVVRIAAWAYQKGFGGHFHNDNGIGALRDIPGLVIATPSRGDDAVGMLRTCVELARREGRVVAFLEPIALYMTKDLHEEGDGGWCFDYPAPGETVAFGQPRVYEPDGAEDADLTIMSWANGSWMSLRAARRLAAEHGVRTRVVDLRWLKPLDEDALLEEASRARRLLVVDEGRATAGAGEGILAVLAQASEPRPVVRRLAGADCYIPIGPADRHVLPTEDKIVAAAVELAGAEAGAGES